jgi:hypothetical protein
MTECPMPETNLLQRHPYPRRPRSARHGRRGIAPRLLRNLPLDPPRHASGARNQGVYHRDGRGWPGGHRAGKHRRRLRLHSPALAPGLPPPHHHLPPGGLGEGMERTRIDFHDFAVETLTTVFEASSWIAHRSSPTRWAGTGASGSRSPAPNASRPSHCWGLPGTCSPPARHGSKPRYRITAEQLRSISQPGGSASPDAPRRLASGLPLSVRPRSHW